MTRPHRLRRVCDSDPGIRRELRDDSFVYLDVDGHEISDPKILARIGSDTLEVKIWLAPPILRGTPRVNKLQRDHS